MHNCPNDNWRVPGDSTGDQHAVQQLEEYITVGTKRMRCGYTTGTCATAAARAAAELLLCDKLVPAVTVSTPAGIDVVVEVEEHEAGEGWTQCAVRKDAGDDQIGRAHV